MVNRIQIKRTSTNANPPADNTLNEGELSIEMGTPTRLWVGVPTSISSNGKKLLLNSAAHVTTLNGASGDIVWTASTLTTLLGYTPVNKAGDTLTGFLTLNAAPTSNLHAATKLYVDSVVPTQTSNSGKYLTTNGSALSWATVDALPTQTSNSGKYLTTDGTTASWATVSGGASLPTQTGNSGKYLTTDGTNTSWSTVNALPTQTGNSGKILTTDGTSASWMTASYLALSGGTLTGLLTLSGAPTSSLHAATKAYVDGLAGAATGGGTDKIFMNNGQSVTTDYTIPTNYNAGTFGPVTVNSGVTVTVPTGSTWSIV